MKSILMTLVCVLLASPLWAQTFEDIPIAQTLTTTSDAGDVRILVRTEDNAVWFSRRGASLPVTHADWTRFPFPVGFVNPEHPNGIWYDVQELISMTTVGDETWVVILTDQGNYARLKSITRADGTEITGDFVIFDPLQREVPEVVEDPPFSFKAPTIPVAETETCNSWFGSSDPNYPDASEGPFTKWCWITGESQPYQCSACPAP